MSRRFDPKAVFDFDLLFFKQSQIPATAVIWDNYNKSKQKEHLFFVVCLFSLIIKVNEPFDYLTSQIKLIFLHFNWKSLPKHVVTGSVCHYAYDFFTEFTLTKNK